MTTNELDYIIEPLPTDDAECLTMLRDAYTACCNDLLSIADRIDDPIMNAFEFGGDDDDYAPAAATLLHAITIRLHYHEYDTPAELIASLFADDDLCHDMLTCDFTTPLLKLIDYRD